jgi:hypothetical protein
MKLHQAIFLRCCLAVMVVGAGVACRAAIGEPIRFSRPAVPIAVELKEDQQLPETRDKRPDFGGSAMQQPTAVQPMVVRTQPREKKRDKDAGKHWLLRDPDKFQDATGRANAREKRANSNSRESTVREKNPTDSEWSDDDSASDRSEKAGALSPISDFHWDARRGDSRSNSWSRTERNSSEKKDSSNSTPFGHVFGRDESSEQGRDSGSSSFSELFAARPKDEKPTEAQLERRAAFERLLNHNTATATRPAGSLEPVTTVETPKAAAPPAAIPSIVSPRMDARPLEPMDAFNQRQAQLRAPVAVDFNKKFNNPVPIAPASAGAASDSPFQTPLMRQPTVRELPARKL